MKQEKEKKEKINDLMTMTKKLMKLIIATIIAISNIVMNRIFLVRRKSAIEKCTA